MAPINKHPVPANPGAGPEHYVASDIPALLPQTRDFLFLEDGDVATLTPDAVRIVTLGARRPGLRAGVFFCHLWARASCRILRIRCEVSGGVPEGPGLVASNHVSYLDILVLGSLYPSVFVAKQEIAEWPIFGWMARRAGTLFVDRTRARDLIRVGGQIASLLELGSR